MKAKKQETAATMKDVALKAKVSTATVSRALMNPDKVSQATRNRVEKAAREVGYLPQPMGRNVKRNESRTILVIVPDICDPFFSEIIRGIEVTAANHGYLVLIGDCAHQNQQEKTFIDLIITKQIDGMLLLGSRLPFDASIEEQRNLPPMVMANEFAPELKLPTVHIDNLTAADGLAVGRASGFVGRAMERLLDGFYTLDDQTMYDMLGWLATAENIRLEPSALAGMAGPQRVCASKAYHQLQGLSEQQLQQATHLVWATGGGMVPEEEMAQYLAKGR